MTQTETAGTTTHPQRWSLLALLGVAQFMLILDVTVVAIALPHLGADLGLTRSSLTWVVSAYTLTFGGLMLVGGRLADRHGPRPLVLTGLAVFVLASLATGLAVGPATVIGGRIGQGLGAALLSPGALSVVVRIFDGDERNRALGIWSALGGAGAAVGVLAGGLLTAGPGWPWVFYVNVPVGLVVLAGLARMLPALPGWGGGPVDLIGAVLLSGATATTIYGFIDAGARGWTDPRVLGLLVAGLALFAVATLWLRQAPHPLIDLGLATRRPVLAGTFVLGVTTALMVAIFFLGTFYLQDAAGHGPLQTGLLFLPVALATMAGAQLGGVLIGPLGARTLGVAALLVAAVGLTVPALWLETWAVVTAVSVAAAGLGVLFVVASVTALSQVGPAEAGVASGILSTWHELGASLGAAVMSGVAAAGLVTGAADGFERAYPVAGGAAAVAALVAAVLLPGRRS